MADVQSCLAIKGPNRRSPTAEREGNRMSNRSRGILAVIALTTSLQASATFSISACDSSGACGVAVATNNLAVGASVPHAQARVGAVASQFETNPAYGPQRAGVARWRCDGGEGANRGAGGGRRLRRTGHRVSPGSDRERRRRHRGSQRCAGARGSLERRAPGQGFAIIGNGLAGEGVLLAMERAYRAAPGALPDRLLAALEAGQVAGGQTIGGMSAALLVRTPAGGFADTDLRVDASSAPVRELRRLYDFTRAHQAMLRAEAAARAGRNRRQCPAWKKPCDSVANGIASCAARRGSRFSLASKSGRGNTWRDFAQLNPAWAQIELQRRNLH